MFSHIYLPGFFLRGNFVLEFSYRKKDRKIILREEQLMSYRIISKFREYITDPVKRQEEIEMFMKELHPEGRGSACIKAYNLPCGGPGGLVPC